MGLSGQFVPLISVVLSTNDIILPENSVLEKDHKDYIISK
jgi:hypothetical protein